tara:strand:- start:2733 stop:3089 length:357 start_codon:yes stop_codon:yes gene_type:complete
MMDWKKPTVQLLGRWQPWHDGHTALFKRAISKTGQVIIQVRDMPISEDNPYGYLEVTNRIISALSKEGYHYAKDYSIIKVPNVTDITYGRDVGYTITKEHFNKEIEDISATKIRKESI